MPSIKSFNLLPCPFCGGDAELSMYYDDNKDKWEVSASCVDTFCQVRPSTRSIYCERVTDEIIQDILNKWNGRAK